MTEAISTTIEENDSLEDKDWVKMVEEELNLIEESWTLELIPSSINKNVVEDIWVFMNKLNKDGREEVKDEVNNSNQNGFPHVQNNKVFKRSFAPLTQNRY